MTFQTVVERQRGALAAALVIEGCPYLPTTGPARWTTLNSDSDGIPEDGVEPESLRPTQLSSALDPATVRWSYGVDLRTGRPQMSAITFKLVDIPGPGGEKHALSSLMLGSVRALKANLAETLDVAESSIEVDSTASWPNAGFAWVNQECKYYTAKAAGPPRFTGAIGGVFHSRDKGHVYEADDPAGRNDGGIRPVIYSVFPHWPGRRVQLWIASVDSDGTLSEIECVWRGKVKTSPAMQDTENGLTWDLVCEHLWDAQDVKILSTAARTKVGGSGGLPLENGEIEWTWTRVGVAGVGGESLWDTLTLSSLTYAAVEDVVLAITTEINAAMLAAGGDDTIQIEVNEDGHAEWWVTTPIAAGHVTLSFNDAVLQAIFGSGTVNIFTTHNEAPADVRGSIQVLSVEDASWLYVTNTSGFVAIDEEGEGSHLRSIVGLGEDVFFLNEVDAGNNRLRVRFLGSTSEQPRASRAVAVPVGETLSVRAGLYMSGDALACWREFLENTSIPEEWRFGLDSDDFDWDEINSGYVAGGTAMYRVRVILGPVSFRDVLIRDLRFAGLLPAISASDAILSVRRLGAPLAAVATHDVDGVWDVKAELPPFAPTRERVCTAVTFKIKSPDATRFGRYEWQPITIDDRTLAQRFGAQEPIEIVNDGFLKGDVSEEDLETHCTQVAQQYFQLFAGDALEGSIPCAVRACRVLPLDVATWSHPTVVSGDTGERGLTGAAILVTKVDAQPFGARSTLTYYMLADGAVRGCWAPSARVTDFVDNGGGAPSGERYELVLDVGNFASHNEGLDFITGMKLILSEWDVEGALSTDALTCTGHNTLGTSVYVSSAPVNDPGAGGEWRLFLNLFNTAAQSAAAQAYATVAGTDNLIFNTTPGFKPS